jgi:hypothetical protein
MTKQERDELLAYHQGQQAGWIMARSGPGWSHEQKRFYAALHFACATHGKFKDGAEWVHVCADFADNLLAELERTAKK